MTAARLDAELAALRPRLQAMAYRMVGGVAEAEDIVQEACARVLAVEDPGTLRSVEAFATTVTTRIAIDHLRSARVRREEYLGPWLPEPVVVDDPPDQHAELVDSLSLAFLVVLESLSPVERAVLLLREVFGYSFAEVAEAVQLSEANCRQVLVRARRHVEGRRPRFEADPAKRDELLRRFLDAAGSGDVARFEQVLAADAVFYSDGGKRVKAARHPIRGRDRVARFLGWVCRKQRGWWRLDPALVNGQPGAVARHDGRVVGVFALDVADGRIQAVRLVVNPDKLRHLG